MNGVAKDLSFEDGKFVCNEEWVQKVGAYGDSSGFGDLAIIPRADKARLIVNPISSYSNCNTNCEYCLERYWYSKYHHLSPMPAEEFARHIPIYKPSILEMTSGELLQSRNESDLKYFFEYLDEIDPMKKLKIEVVSNGIDLETIKKYYGTGRIQLQLSLEPCVKSNNPRKTQGERQLRNIAEIAKINPRQMEVLWMIRPDYERGDFKWFRDKIKELGVIFSIQPVNQVTGFYEVDTEFNLEFIKNIQEDWPEFHKWYPYTSLVFPKLSCFEGNIVLTGQGGITTCKHNSCIKDRPYNYAEYMNFLKPVKVSAGVCHACSYLTSIDFPKNYKDLERLGYSMMGVNLMKTHGERAGEAADAIKEIYLAEVEFKKAATSEIGDSDPNVATELIYPHNGTMSKMNILRLLENIGIAAKTVTSIRHIEDDMWFTHTDGEDVICYDLDYFLTNRVDPEQPVAVYTMNNFPAQIWTMGRAKDVRSAINNSNKRIYPKELAALPCLSKKISHFIKFQN